MKSLREFFKTVYTEKPWNALCMLASRKYTNEKEWYWVFHEGIGEGVYSKKEGIVAVFDEDDVDVHNEYTFYKYDPNAWVNASTPDDWKAIYDGRNGENYPVELAD